MGSVPNCQKEIPACHAIRWFKCKLKPPKKVVTLTPVGREEGMVIMVQEAVETRTAVETSTGVSGCLQIQLQLMLVLIK